MSAVQTPEPETADTVQAAAEPSGEPVGDASALLAPIEAAFARGDFLLTRALATRLLRSNPPDALRVELEAIVARTEPDRRARWVLLIAAATVFLITALAYAQGRAHLP